MMLPIILTTQTTLVIIKLLGKQDISWWLVFSPSIIVGVFWVLVFVYVIYEEYRK